MGRVVLVVLVIVAVVLLWKAYGPRSWSGSTPTWSWPRRPEPPAIKGPDDDEAFLMRLERKRLNEEKKRWEEQRAREEQRLREERAAQRGLDAEGGPDSPGEDAARGTRHRAEPGSPKPQRGDDASHNPRHPHRSADPEDPEA